jgi:hypothetical protein
MSLDHAVIVTKHLGIYLEWFSSTYFSIPEGTRRRHYPFTGAWKTYIDVVEERMNQ